MPDEVSPAMAGAVPNTDATTALQAIAKFTGYDPSVTPVLPANPPDLVIDNVYQVSGVAGVLFKRSIKIRGTAKGLITFIPTATGLSGSVFFQFSNNTATTANSDVTLEDLTFQGQLGDYWTGPFSGTYSPVYPEHLVLIDNAGYNSMTVPRRNVHIRRCKFIGGVIGLGGTQLTDSTISDCIAEYQYYQGFGLDGEYDGLSITNCIARWTGNEGFKIGSDSAAPFTGRGLKVIGNYAEGCGWLGLVASRSSTTEGFDCYWTSTDNFTIMGNTANRCHDGGWEMKTARAAPLPDPINETYSNGVVSGNTVINVTDNPGFQLKMEGNAPFTAPYIQDIAFNDNLIKYDYPSVYVTLGANPIMTTMGSNVVTVTWANHNAKIGDIVMVRGMQPDSMATTIGGIAPSAMFKFFPISAIGVNGSGITTVSFVADSYATANEMAGGGSNCYLFCWYADNRPLPVGCMTVSGGSGTTIIVTYPSVPHGCHSGDIAYIQGATDPGGSTVSTAVNGRFIITVTGLYTFTFKAVQTVTASSSFGGANAFVAYQTVADISTGSSNRSMGTGSSGFLIWAAIGVSFANNKILDGYNGYYLVCTAGSTTPAWLAGTYYGNSALVQNVGNNYSTGSTSGTSSATAPTGTGVVDGTLTWTQYGPAPQAPTPWAANTSYKLNNLQQNFGYLYICRTAGTSASTGSGPTGLGTGIPDNTCRWDFVTAMWMTGTVYRPNDLCYTGTQVYRCILGGVSGTTAPSGTGTVSDGVCQWSSITGNNGVYAPAGDINGVTIQGGHIRCQNAVFLDCMQMDSILRNLTILPGNWEFWYAGILTNAGAYPYAVQNCIVRGGVLRAITTFRGRGIDGVPNHTENAGIRAVSWISSEISGVSIYSIKPIYVLASLYGTISQSLTPAILVTNCTLNAAYDSVVNSSPIQLDDNATFSTSPASNTYALQNNYITPPSGNGYASWTGAAADAQVQSFGNVIGYSTAAPAHAGKINDLILCTNAALTNQGWRCTRSGPAGGGTPAIWTSY